MGLVKIVNERNETTFFATTAGFTEVRNNRISILVESAENANDIKTADIDKKLAEMRQKLEKTADKDENDILRAEILELENRLKAVSRQKNK